MDSMFSMEVKTNPWIPRGLIVMTDRFGEVVGVIDNGYARQKFFRLLNLGSINE